MPQQKFDLGAEVFIVDEDLEGQERVGTVISAILKPSSQIITYGIAHTSDPVPANQELNTYREEFLIPKEIVDEYVADLLTNEGYVKKAQLKAENVWYDISVDNGSGDTNLFSYHDPQEAIQFLIDMINKAKWPDEFDPDVDNLVLTVTTPEQLKAIDVTVEGQGGDGNKEGQADVSKTKVDR